MDSKTSYIISQIKDKYNYKDVSIKKFHTIGNSKNLIIEFVVNENEYILRVSDNDESNYKFIESEVKWLDYLAENNVSVARPKLSTNSNLLESINCEGKLLNIVIFDKAKGHLVDCKNSKKWNNSLFKEWGSVMGKIHSLSNSFKENNSIINRKHWNENMYFSTEIYNPTNIDEQTKKRWERIVKRINLLEKNKFTYGLIHYDFHQYNFFVDNNKITVFDFDDCVFHWFICDISIALFHALFSLPIDENEKRKKFAKIFLENFMEGYNKEFYIGSKWQSELLLFLDYRMISSYTFLRTLNISDTGTLKVVNWLETIIKKDLSYVKI